MYPSTIPANPAVTGVLYFAWWTPDPALRPTNESGDSTGFIVRRGHHLPGVVSAWQSSRLLPMFMVRRLCSTAARATSGWMSQCRFPSTDVAPNWFSSERDVTSTEVCGFHFVQRTAQGDSGHI